MSIFSGNAVAQLIFQSDMVSQSVLMLLFLLSIVCWTVFLQRYVLLRLKNKQVVSAYNALLQVTTLPQLSLLSTTLKDTFPDQLLTPANKLLNERLVQKINPNSEEKEIFSHQLFTLFDTLIKKETAYFSLFIATAEIATLVGLFGTIWGLIHSFVRISERQSADIITVAPGIAEALITTLAGLLVAIPTIVLYHVLSHAVYKVELHLASLIDRYELIAKKLWEREVAYAHAPLPSAEKQEFAAGQSNAPY